MKKILIIDYKMCNLGSVRRALEECGADAKISDSPKDLDWAQSIILPGVGVFSDGMNHLQELGWIEPLKKAVVDIGMPLLGICLGMQLLASEGEEGRKTKGLGYIPGKVIKLQGSATGQERIPHIGWNEVYMVNHDSLYKDIPEGADFYFVHSYHFCPESESSILSKTPYCSGVISSVQKDSIYGVQFHPEKSSRVGLQLLKNFVTMV